MDRAPKVNLADLKTAEEKDASRSPGFKHFLEEKFVDKAGYSDRHQETKDKAKDLKHTTPFIRSGFIDKSKLSAADPNSIFDKLGFDKGLRNFKFSGQTTTARRTSLMVKQASNY